MIGTVLQTADASLVALLLFVGLAVATVLATVVLARGIGAYRRTRDPGLLGLAVGIALLSGVPILANVVLQTLTGVPAWQVSAFADLLRLAGLGLVLYVIYGTTR